MTDPTAADRDFELDLTAMAHGGSAIGRHEGRAVFVPYAIPGERVRARLTHDRGRFAMAEVIEVLQASPSRVTPRCPHFGPGLCGGCHLQHIDYAAQLDLKRQIVIDQMTRIGGFSEVQVLPMLPSPDPWRYRTHSTLHATPEGALGFVTTDDQHIIEIEECHIIRPELMELLETLDLEGMATLDRVRLQVGTAGEDRLIALSTHDDLTPEITLDLPVSVAFLPAEAAPYTLIGQDYVTYTLKGRHFRVRAGGFFQVNLAQAERLIDLVIDFLALTGTERVLDLYAGVGLFTAFIAANAAAVTSVESYLPAVEDAELNLSDFPGIALSAGAVEDVLPHLEGHYDAAVVDPPRAGMEGAALDELAALAPTRIVYVSCDLATFARDAKRLAAKGYHLGAIQPIDMFPQTASIELVAVFTR